jgi:Tol biopolymer transport system component
MGEVYRARDSRLNREVAIKVSAVAFGDRFQREARAIAALNHPNICTVHDVGPNYLVMELIEGETLADHLRSGPIAVQESLRIAIQIAQALEAAHEKGIVHRDLKPANVKIKPDGTVKVLDFGLAKTLAGPETSADLANSPTYAGTATQGGLILGTAAYMSPEQARGAAVDQRTDVWAFGCVLFEMLTGKRPFGGDTVTDALAAILKTEPDWTALPPGIPALVRSVLRRCLRKDAVQRLRDIADARLEIQEALAEPDVAPAVPAGQARTTWRTTAPWGLSAVLAAVIAWLLLSPPGRGGATASLPVTRLELELPARVEPYLGGSQSIAFSPDGRVVAYIGIVEGNRQVYMRRMDEGATVPVKGTEGATAIFFAPNGRSVGVIITNGMLVRISLDDSLVTTLVRNADINAGGTWSVDDRITFGRSGVLWQIPALGGTETQLTTLGKDEIAHVSPVALPSGGAILFTVVAGSGRGATRVEALSGVDRRRRSIIQQGMSPVYARSGHLIFYRDASLLAVAFDAERVEPAGTPVRFVDAVRISATGSAVMSISDTGSMVYMSGTSTNRLVWVSRLGVDLPFGDAPRPYTFPGLSRDGRRLAVSADGEVWFGDTQRGVLARVTTGSTAGNTFPVLTPDGKRVLFRTRTGLAWMDTEGSGRSGDLPGTSTLDYPTSVSPDGKWLAFLHIGGDNSGDVYVTALNDSSKPRPLVNSSSYEGGGMFSPDGKWIAYTSDESGPFQIFVRPFNGPERKWLVAQSGKYPRWNQNGKELFYRDGNKMMALDVSMSGDEPTIGTPRVLFEQRYEFGQGQTTANYDVTPDGQRFVMVKGEAGSNRLNVILNAFEELRRLAPPAR